MSISTPTRAPAPQKAQKAPKAPSEHIEAGVRRMFAAGALSQLRFMGYDRTVRDRSLCIEIWTCPSEADLAKPAEDRSEPYYLTIDFFSKSAACTCPGSQGRPTCKHQELLKVKLGLRGIQYPRCKRCNHHCYQQDPVNPNRWTCHLCAAEEVAA